MQMFKYSCAFFYFSNGIRIMPQQKVKNFSLTAQEKQKLNPVSRRLDYTLTSSLLHKCLLIHIFIGNEEETHKKKLCRCVLTTHHDPLHEKNANPRPPSCIIV